jgi:hypothetical protein
MSSAARFSWLNQGIDSLIAVLLPVFRWQDGVLPMGLG